MENKDQIGWKTVVLGLVLAVVPIVGVWIGATFEDESAMDQVQTEQRQLAYSDLSLQSQGLIATSQDLHRIFGRLESQVGETDRRLTDTIQALRTGGGNGNQITVLEDVVDSGDTTTASTRRRLAETADSYDHALTSVKSSLSTAELLADDDLLTAIAVYRYFLDQVTTATFYRSAPWIIQREGLEAAHQLLIRGSRSELD